MEPCEYSNESIVHKILGIISQSSLSDANNTVHLKEFHCLCQVFTKKFEGITLDLLSNPLCWKTCTVVLLYLNLFRKLSIFIVQECNPLLDPRPLFDIIFSKKFAKYMYSLSTTHEKIVRFTAQDVIVQLVVELGTHKDTVSYSESVVKNIYCSIDEKPLGTKSWHWNVDIITSLLKQFKRRKIDLSELVLAETLNFFQKYTSAIYNDEVKERFFSTLCFFREIINVDSDRLLVHMYKNFSLLLKNFHSHILQSSHRQLYITILKDLLHYPQQLQQSPFCVDAAKSYHDMIHSSAGLLKKFFECQPHFVGFGGRKTQSLISDNLKAIVGFSKIERMFILNGTLKAVCILLHYTTAEFATQPTEALLKYLIDVTMSLPTHLNVAEKIIEIYIEQDDTMIEMLLLHLTICISPKLTGSTFLASPHALFVQLLREISYDSSVLLDWLTSNETQFLLYLLKYLKFVVTNFRAFCMNCNSLSSLNRSFSCVVSTLTRLRCSIEKLCSKHLFPYPVKPLLKVIVAVETLAKQSDDELCATLTVS